MNIKVNAVAIVVMSSLSAGMSNVYAGFNETPYVSYLSDDDFDAAFTEKQQLAVPMPRKLHAVVRIADKNKSLLGVKKDANPKEREDITSQTVKIEQTVSAKPITEAPAATEAMQVKSPIAPGCPAEEIGYIAPCL